MGDISGNKEVYREESNNSQNPSVKSNIPAQIDIGSGIYGNNTPFRCAES